MFFFSLHSEDRLKDGELTLNNHYNQPIDVMRRFFDRLVRGLSTQNTIKVHIGFTTTVGFCYMN